MAAKACLEKMPPPAFSPNPYTMLPWMHPGNTHFILAYNYAPDRRAGRRFERGGIGGLIGEGFFASLYLAAPDGKYDGAELSRRYVKRGRCGGQDIWLRRKL
jgi:hypothetical protein